MNTYWLMFFIGFERHYVELTGNTPQDAVDLFRQTSAAPVFCVWDADTGESEVDWE